MDPSDPPAIGHPLVAVLGRVESALDDAAGLPVWFLDAACTADVLTRLIAVESRVAAARLAVLAHGDVVDVGGPSGSPNTATWLATSTRATRPDAFSQTRLAASLESTRHTCVRDALAGGRLRVDQAKVIVHAVDQLGTETDDLPAGDAVVVAKAEAWLVGQAAHHDAKRLRILGQRLLEVVAPDLADLFEAKRLEREEKRAAEHARLTMSDDGHGSVFVKAKIPQLHGAMLKKALLAYAAPQAPGRHRSPRRTVHPGAAAVTGADGQGVLRPHRVPDRK